ncbi:MAG: hypothetical protein VYA60_04920 [Pseudomonadota bacterium]|nr:hypothetical protein [Pseudomonadota bacterium]
MLKKIHNGEGLSDEGKEFIESAIAPRYISGDSELYLLKHLIDSMNDGDMVFSEEDTAMLRETAKIADYIELSVGSLRRFLPR